MHFQSIPSIGFLSFLAIALTPGWSSAEPGSSTIPSKGKTVDFTRDIKPILANSCLTCHGNDPKALKGGLRLDSAEFAYRAQKSGEKPIVPGQPGQSEVVKRIFSKDANEVMPPPDSGKSLKPADRDLLRKWIEEGAEYKTHWAFVKPQRPAIPTVTDKGRIKNEIDAFILARLEQAKLKPAPEADRTTLIRRLSLDLRGFGPSLAEVDEFLNDKRPDAYEHLVDRMLASPHYGEKMAQIWLDLARFGDTSGFHADSTRQMWVWRDNVINAYNKNQPYNQFTIEQLAGDLIPNATLQQKIASGFNRNTRFNEEGGADPEEFVIRYNVDRTNTLGQVWLGMTLNCAECHSHKYDPISQKEYYQLYAFFTGIREPMVSMNHGQPLPPLLKIMTPQLESKIAQTKKEREQVLHEISAALKKVEYKEPQAEAAKPAESKDVVWIDDNVPAGAMLQGDGANPWNWGSAPEFQVQSGKRSTKRTGKNFNQHFFTGANPPLVISSTRDKLFAYVWLDPKDPPKGVMLQWNDGNWEHRAYWGESKFFESGKGDKPSNRMVGPLPKLGEWVRLEVSPDLVGLKSGSQINGWAFSQFDGTVYYDTAGIRTMPANDRASHSLLAWEQKDKANAKLPAEVVSAFKVEAGKRNDAQKAALRDHYLRFVFAATRSTFDPLNKKLESLDQQIKQTEDSVPTTMVSEEMEKPRDAYVLLRGDFLHKGDKVERGLPAIFPSLPKNAPMNRLGLAQWLVSPDHPLTARVTVNRLWGQMFGTGIVKTMGDFGTQGELPSHPELLDWLATEFIATGWDTKAILKKMALSATYRQSSNFGDKLPDADPHNRLLYRAPRYRLTAEEIRDNALAVSGLLSRKIGGPSVMPYQPANFYTGKNESWPWQVSTGEDAYRRGMYTFWRRTCLHPMFALFDAPSREECSAARPRTNTPLQALVTLNDPTFVEAARVFAQDILTRSSKDVDAKITFAFRSALSRTPSDIERTAIKKRYQALIERYKKDPKAAAEVVKVGKYPQPEKMDPIEHAAWFGVANILLNLDETITRE